MNSQVPPVATYKLYKRRWFMLAVVIVLNLSNSTLWISFAPIANKAEEFYCVSKGCGAANIMSIIFMICSIPIGFVAMWSVDKFGLRTGILAGAWVNLIGSAIRIISSIAPLQHSARFPLAIVGQTIAACAQPFIMYLPTKLAALWFPDDQRAIANTAGSMSNPLGILVAMFLAPAIVSSDTPDAIQNEIFWLNTILTIPAIVVTVASTLGVCSSIPKQPPTHSAGQDAAPFWTGLKMMYQRKAFIPLALFLGGGMGLFNAIYTLIQQILCPKGYSNFFAGLCGGVVIAAGFVGAAIAAIIADKTKLFEEISKICYGIAAICASIFAIFVLRSDYEAAIAILIGLFGAFGFGFYPIGLELGVECTYPAAEATSAGFIIISGQIQGIIYVIIFQLLAGPPSAQDQLIETCTSGADSNVTVNDWRIPVFIWAGIAVLQGCCFILLFWPKYNRMKAEQEAKETNSSTPNLEHIEHM